jgi:uncharacterized membrane protein YheB (UPF0754 family)
MGINAEITVPDKCIEDMVKAEIVKKLSDNPAVVERFISEVLSAKSDRYGSESQFASMTKKMIQEAGKEVFNEWLSENRELIKKAVFTYLNNNKQKALKDLAEKMASGLSNFYFQVYLRVSDD